MECDSSIMEMKIEPAKALLSFLQNKISPKIESVEATLKPVSRVFYTHMGSLGFISEAYRFPNRSYPCNFNISNPFQVILVPNQTTSLYKAVHDTSSHGLNEILDSKAWSFFKAELNDDLINMGFKNEYIYCRETSGKHFEEKVIPFVHIPELEITLWETMRKVDSFYFEKIRERVPTFGQSTEKGPEVVEGDAPETGIVPFNETGGLVHLVGFNSNVSVVKPE